MSKFNTESKETQIKRFYNYLRRHTSTCSMAAEALDLRQKNCCRYKRELEKNGYLWEVKKAPCKITGYKADYLTTNERKAPVKPCQLKISL